MKRVVVAMSGGVDSSVAAALLKKEGHQVIGVFMQFWFPSGEIYGENKCCSTAAYQQARRVADILGIKIYKINFGKEFKKIIVDEFLKAYAAGLTPNPCVVCNRFIKFDLLLKKAKTVFGADYLATGHYVKKTKKQENKKAKYFLLRGKDKAKDQSYFLYNLTQKQLPHLLFPLGDYTKAEVRGLAKKFNLPVAEKRDSQEICFVGASHYDFLKKYLKLRPGKIISDKGEILGRHSGLPLYTIGQRSGLGLSSGPWYVAGFKRQKNLLLVTKNQKKSVIYQKKLKFYQANWLAAEPKSPLKCRAQIRYHGQIASCLVKKQKGSLLVEFKKKQRAIMPGQSVVFYQRDCLLGGGVIRN